jgi:hypothetical protein
MLGLEAVIAGAKERYCAKMRCRLETLDEARDTFECQSDDDFPVLQ